MADIGHNSAAVTPGGMAVVSMGQIAQAEAARDAANDELKKVKKKVEANGLNLRSAADAMKAFRTGKIQQTIQRYATTIAYMQVLGAMITRDQLDLVDVLEADPTAEERGYAEGLAAGRLDFAGNAASPYSPSLPQGQAWLKGYHLGRDEQKAIMAMTSEHQIVQADKPRRGRAAGSKNKAKATEVAPPVEQIDDTIPPVESEADGEPVTEGGADEPPPLGDDGFLDSAATSSAQTGPLDDDDLGPLLSDGKPDFPDGPDFLNRRAARAVTAPVKIEDDY